MVNSYKVTISGVARCGKNLSARSAVKYFREFGIFAKEYSFAYELRKECNPFTLLSFGISAFTENDDEKKIIRPLLLCVGTQMWRNLDVDHWVKKVDEAINNDPHPHIAVLSDGRFSNEIEWSNKNGTSIHLTRTNNGIPVPPNNKDEQENDPLVKNLCKFHHSWETFGSGFEDSGYYSVANFLKEAFSPEQISQWQNDFPIPTQN